MSKHPFDPVALVFGLVFGAAGVIVLTDGRLIDEGRVLLPLGLVALGVGLLFRPARPSPGPAGPAEPAGPAPTPAQPLSSPPVDDPAAEHTDDAGTADESPDAPGAEFYLGPGWRASGDDTPSE